MQKFKKGDHVKIADDLGATMSHFTSGVEAIVQYSYADKFGGNNTNSYSLYIKNLGSSSWYYESQLTLIEANRHDLLEKWKKEAEEDRKQKSDINWIFENGKEVIENCYGDSIETLGERLGYTNLWGSKGEGFVYYQNAIAILNFSTPFLDESDLSGFLEEAKNIKSKMK